MSEQAPPVVERFCAMCGAPRSGHGKFCASCGASYDAAPAGQLPAQPSLRPTIGADPAAAE